MFKDSDGSYDLAIIDFGLATEESRYASLFKSCGTKGYMAPEILNTQPHTVKSDLFAVGVIFYMMLTGVPPFSKNGEDPIEIEKKNKEASPCYDWVSFGMTFEQNEQVLVGSFLRKLITKRPEDRMSAKEALEHGIFQLQKLQHSTVEQPTTVFGNNDVVSFLK